MDRARSSSSPPWRVRVVTLVDFLTAQSGAERLALDVATHLDPARFESTLCISRWPPPGEPDAAAREALEQLSASGVELVGLGRRGKLDVWVWWRLVRLLRRKRVDVLHAHKFGSNVWGTLAGRLARVPVVLAHEHTWSYEGQPMRRLLDRELIARGADRFIAVSREDQRRMIEVEKIDPARTLYLPNGIRPAAPFDERDLRAELGIAPQVPLIGLVGVLRPQKAVHVLLRAIAALRPETPDVQALVVGEGPERARLERLAAELSVADAVRFLGHRSDVPALLRALDIAVCSSDYEGSPLAVLEYMEAGLPIVSTAVGGIPDLIESGVHGLLVPAEDPPALASAVAELLREPQRARQMGAQARARRLAEFDFDAMVRRIEALYDELLSAHRRAPSAP